MAAAGQSDDKTFSLFVYGTLRDPSVFRAVLGRRIVSRAADADGTETFHAREAILDGYKKVSPDNTYLYAVPERHARIHGYVIGPLPDECLAALRKYEGRNYSRRRLRVLTAQGPVRAVAFVGNLKKLEHSFGYAFRDPLKQEILLQEKIEKALLETEREQLHSEDEPGRRAIAELHAATIRDLKRHHFDAGGISDYAIRQSLKEEPLRDFSRIVDDPEARALAPNYLTMAVRQVIFNQFEEKIHRDFRYELDRMQPSNKYHDRAISSLTALRVLNARAKLLEVVTTDCLAAFSFTDDHLVDYVRWAISAADAIYDPHAVRREMQLLRTHMTGGYIPLGVELEFSDIGHEVIRDPQGKHAQGRRYDGFIFFSDFALDILTWKLGGHLDDHHEKASIRPRRGFFETALGSLSIEAGLSKPITDDPWMLNQFIHQARQFFRIAPHSIHISLQLRRQHHPVRDRPLSLGAMKCLFAIAGDTVREEDGRTRIRRLTSDEIVTKDTTSQMMFSEISKRRSSDSDSDISGVAVDRGRATGRYVQQFKFLRLAEELYYEPIIMALKGLQLSMRPGSFLTPAQFESSPKHRKLFEKLLAWGAGPEPLSNKEIEAFIRHVHDGLMTERRGKPAHTKVYIAWVLSELREMLSRFNQLCTDASPAGLDR